jgi:predicted flap endonuclease-1-like 5' DNA nuclease
MNNREIAARLRAYAGELELVDGNLFRVRAYRQAAAVVDALPRPLTETVAERGLTGLEEIPGIGPHLAFTLEGLVRDGEFRSLSRNEGGTAPAHRLTSVPGIGPRLARRLHEELGISNLSELDEAARDGRLHAVGVGDKRLRGILDALAVRLGPARCGPTVVGEPDVADFLHVDEEFREWAQSRREAQTGRRRSSERFPTLTIERNGWRFQAHTAESALAHRMHARHDWVEIEFARDQRQGQRTVVTENRGCLRGQRVVRGRESESVAASLCDSRLEQ